MDYPFPSGGRVFRLPNQTGGQEPIIESDLVSIYVEAARVPKTSSWLRSDCSVALSFKVLASYTTASSNRQTTNTTIAVTKAYSFDVTRDESGNVCLPLKSLVIVDSCPLTTFNQSDRAILTDLTICLTLLATQKQTGFSTVLQEVFKLSGKLPVPNPYTPFVNLLGDGISDVIQKIQLEQANPHPLSNISFQFIETDAALSGYYVMLMSTDQQFGNGFVDLDNLDQKLLKLDASGGLMYNGDQCRNAYVVLRVGYVKASNFLPLGQGARPQESSTVVESCEEVAGSTNAVVANPTGLDNLNANIGLVDHFLKFVP